MTAAIIFLIITVIVLSFEIAYVSCELNKYKKVLKNTQQLSIITAQELLQVIRNDKRG